MASDNSFPPDSLRDWLDRLAAAGRLALIQPNRGLEFDLAAIAAHYEGEKATLFPSPGGHPMPVVSGVVARREWIADALGIETAQLPARFHAAMTHPVPCQEVGDAPVHEVVHDGDIDLHKLLPAPVHNAKDGGQYITAGLLICRNIKTGRQNVSINRCQLQGGNRLGVDISSRDTGTFFAMSEAAGESLKCAIVIGVDPITLLASQAVVPMDQDELEIAGALRGRPLPVAKCMKSELRVPAQAEIVLEGRILANQRGPEGPFGEFTQYYGPRGDRFVIEIDAVTHRRAPIYQTITGGSREHLLLGAVAREASFLSSLRSLFPTVKAVHLPLAGVGRFHLVVQVEKMFEGLGKNVILGAFALHHDLKQVVVVDPDVDIFDAEQVEWAVATRFQPDRDMVLISGARSSKLDPTSRIGVGSKWGIDATVKLDAPEGTFERIRVPGQDEVDGAAVLNAVAPKDWRAALS